MAENVIACPSCGKAVVVPKQQDLPQGLDTICQQFPNLCKVVNGLHTQIKEISESLNRHPKPTTELINLWESCPECKAAWEKLKREHPESLQPKDDVPWWEKEEVS